MKHRYYPILRCIFPGSVYAQRRSLIRHRVNLIFIECCQLRRRQHSGKDFAMSVVFPVSEDLQ